jgi:multiple sugar transport system ATP-binding protein
MVFQNYALYPHMTVGDNIGFSLRVSGMRKEQRDAQVRAVARTLGLENELHRRPRQLSGGQRQRVAMGRAIVRQPQAFLMDEPLSNLDASLRFQMRAEIASLQAQLGVTTIYVTHDQVEAMTIGRRVAVLRRGRLLQFDDPQSLYDHPVDLFVARFIGSPPMNLVESQLEHADGGYAVRIGSSRVALGDDELRSAAGIDAYVGKDVVVGIRPDRLEDAAVVSDAPADRRIAGTSTLRETLGSDVLVHFAVDGGRPLSSAVRAIAQDAADPVEVKTVDRALSFIGRFSPRSRVQMQEQVDVAVQPGAIQMFDPADGSSLLRGVPAGTAAA